MKQRCFLFLSLSLRNAARSIALLDIQIGVFRDEGLLSAASIHRQVLRLYPACNTILDVYYRFLPLDTLVMDASELGKLADVHTRRFQTENCYIVLEDLTYGYVTMPMHSIEELTGRPQVHAPVRDGPEARNEAVHSGHAVREAEEAQREGRRHHFGKARFPLGWSSRTSFISLSLSPSLLSLSLLYAELVWPYGCAALTG